MIQQINKPKINFFATPIVILIIIFFLALMNVILGFYIIHLVSQNAILSNTLKAESSKQQFSLLSPTIAWLSVEEFIKQQKIMTVSLSELKPKILLISTTGVNGTYGVYLEDLTTGAWLGINEKDRFVPASLLKLPVMIAVLKKIENNELSIDQKVIINASDINLESGTLGFRGAGYEISVRNLLKIMINESDNTAYLTFVKRLIASDDLTKVALAMGFLSIEQDNRISPRDYSNMLRSLYYSTFLKRQFSELGLSLMLETEFTSQIPSGVPSNISVSHKVGMFKVGGYYHDCGIVYLPNKPYILCVMSVNSTQEESNRVISSISKEVFAYMNQKLEADTNTN